MSKRWEDRWVRVKGAPQGGQAVSFIAKPKDGNGPQVFIKTLNQQRMRQHQARGRFMREVAIYESLKGLGLPELYDDNTETWADGNTPLYMATEFIDGPNLWNYITQQRRTADIADALECVRELATVLNRCHQNGITHRDIKPANIICTGGAITKPRLVDFGISFNNAADDDLTRQNEDVGNRFLHLPEHARGGQSPASDVTQLAGIFLYTVTGHEPRVLQDEANRMPHQRLEIRAALAAVLDERPLLRITAVLDNAFANDLSRRYQTAPELISALETAMQDQQGSGDLEDLLAQVDERIVSEGIAERSQRRDALAKFIDFINRAHGNFASSRGLHSVQGGNDVRVTPDEEWHENHLAVFVPGTEHPNPIPKYRVERRGTEYVLLLNGEELWRGNDVDERFAKAVQIAIAKQFLALRATSGSGNDNDSQPNR